jgi:SAM-dependent methyltransferase
MLFPSITVTKADGEVIREMTLDLSPDATDAPMFLDCADVSKTITFSVRFSSFLDVAEITLQPTAYDAETGILTVSVLGAEGQEGCTLFDCGAIMNGYPMSVYLYRLQIPAGMFFNSRNEKIRNAETGRSYYLRSIENMPFRTVAELRTPSWIRSLENKTAEIFHSEKAADAIAFVYLLSWVPALIRADLACLRSLRDYGVSLASINWFAVLFESVKGVV